MFGEGVLIVLINYRRFDNMPKVIQAWRGQSVPPKQVVVVDNSPLSIVETYPKKELHGCWDVWRFTQNLGCPSRFAPALCLFGHRYVLFADDDLLPGRRALEHLLEAAKAVGDQFSTLGGTCRSFVVGNPPGGRYSGRSTPLRSKDHPVKCHLTCQHHLVRADVFHHVVAFRNRLLDRFGDEAAKLCSVHEDFMTSVGAQMGTGWPTYATPLEAERDRMANMEYLPGANDETACWKRPSHFAERNRMVDLCLEMGWRPLT